MQSTRRVKQPTKTDAEESNGTCAQRLVVHHITIVQGLRSFYAMDFGVKSQVVSWSARKVLGSGERDERPTNPDMVINPWSAISWATELGD